jgi:hypothetical protein
MTGRQLDLFSGTPPPPEAADGAVPRGRPKPADLGDAALVEAIPQAGLAYAPALAAEAVRRSLDAAVPALERLCRRFIGFGAERLVPEQASALEALATIGGPAAAAAVTRIIVERAVEGPTMRIALGAAVRLGSRLPDDVVSALLRHADRRVRADACRLVDSALEAAVVLVDLLDDLDADVAIAAACALGRFGRSEGKSMLIHRLQTAPSAEVIDAVVALADADCVVLLARIARRRPALAAVALHALEQIDHPLAAKAVTTLLPRHQRDPRTMNSPGGAAGAAWVSSDGLGAPSNSPHCGHDQRLKGCSEPDPHRFDPAVDRKGRYGCVVLAADSSPVAPARRSPTHSTTTVDANPARNANDAGLVIAMRDLQAAPVSQNRH